MIGLFAALVLFAQAAPASGPTVAPAMVEAPKTDVQPKAEAKATPAKLVCHDETVAGSHFKTKVCQTKRAETIRAQEDQDQFRRARDQNQILVH